MMANSQQITHICGTDRTTMPTTPKEIGRLIQEIRKGKGFTQATFAEKMGVAESTVASYEVGRNNFTVTTLKKISDALGCELKIEIIV